MGSELKSVASIKQAAESFSHTLAAAWLIDYFGFKPLEPNDMLMVACLVGVGQGLRVLWHWKN